MPPTELLAARLRTTFDAWLRPAENRWSDFWTNWRGLGDGNQPDDNCIAVVQYCRAAECVADSELQRQLSVFDQIRPDEHLCAAGCYVPRENKQTPEGLSDEQRRVFRNRQYRVQQSRQHQLAALVQGLVATVQAAIAHVGGDNDLAGQKLARAAECYDRAWKLTSVRVESSEVDNLFEHVPPRSVRLLRETLQSPHGSNGMTVSTWLILQRLLATLFSEPLDHPDAFHNHATLLLVKPDGRGDPVGHLEDALVESLPGPQLGLLLDPLTFGTTLLSPSLQQSLRLALRCCRQSWKATNSRASGALRLEIELPWWATLLEGDSAGGLLAGALLATARREPLDVRRSATVALQLDHTAEQNDLAPLTAEQVLLKKVGGVIPKLRAAGKLDAALDQIALHIENDTEWQAHDGRFALRPLTTGVTTLAEVLDVLRGEARYEDVLERHCEAVEGEWKRLEDQGADGYENDEHRFDCYVHPTYHIERPRPLAALTQEASEPTGPEVEPVPGERDDALRHLLGQLTPERGLVVYDRAGAGKTVFSLRLRHVAAGDDSRNFFNRRAPLVVRLHGGWWPEPPYPRVREILANDAILRRLVPEKAQRRAVVDYALKEQRVVLILDGFDQFHRAERDHVADLLRLDHAAADSDARNCGWVITSRVHCIDEQSQLFDAKRWLRVGIDPLSPELQDKYFELAKNHPGFPEWRQLMPDQDGTDDLLGLPLVLRMLRRVLEKSPQGEPLPRFHTLGELFLRVSRDLLERALLTSIEEGRLSKVDPGLDPKDRRLLPLLEHVLSLLGFQMLLDQNYNGTLQGRGEDDVNEVSQFLDRARSRYFRENDEQRRESSLPESKKDDLRKRAAKMQDDWDRAVRVLMAIELNHRAVLEALDAQMIAFRNRKMVECYAALYLTKYATVWDREATDATSAWDFTGDGQWKSCWQLLIEMPCERSFENVWVESLSLLFRPTRKEKEQLRPTELMFRAWQLLKREDSPHLKPILQSYRQEFLDILNIGDEEQGKLAAQLVPEFVLAGYVPDEARRKEIAPHESHPAYVRCPPAGDRLEFWMGTAEDAPHGRDDEKPRHPVAVPAFWMAACAVTRAQYRLFDPNLEIQARGNFDRVSPDPDCPVIDTNWYDGFCLALWLGDEASLPTELEWEGAARGGRDGPADVIGIPPYDASFTPGQVNFNRNRTLPVRWDAERREAASEDLHQIPVYAPNAFGIWQAHGNGDEWCQSVCDRAIYQRRAAAGERVLIEAEDVVSFPVSVGRVIRGGTWSRNGFDCRSAYRDASAPDGTYGGFGLRLCWRSRRVSPESSCS